ncbi:putative enoyl-CoA hydratase precursor, mitochondrial [Fusarium austroafricanum]|uniref:Putative enoyl-CoA hydratase, mitochondrial n=1 Tax=Fusarium austroafricanum TaxID=2364996 RepID=A0A8H4KJB0_9HYPO|nr:putative enoyl-CoA hydratase precursor, mitochondrial [Fusarium austroafricanum]
MPQQQRRFCSVDAGWFSRVSVESKTLLHYRLSDRRGQNGMSLRAFSYTPASAILFAYILGNERSIGPRILACKWRTRPRVKQTLQAKRPLAGADYRISGTAADGSQGPWRASHSGADIGEISRLDAEDARRCRYLADLCSGMQAVRKPVIAAVEGMALGGGFELALMCDLIFSAHGSRFGLPEVTIGLIPGAGGTQRLTNAVGKFKAMQMILLGQPISAEEARSAGLVTQLYESGKVLEHVVKEHASTLAALSPTALSLAKEAICRSDDLGADHEFERSLYYFAFGTGDKQEGVKAFLEKRKPDWGTK